MLTIIANHTLKDPLPSPMNDLSKYEAKESGMPRFPRFELVCHQTFDINLLDWSSLSLSCLSQTHREESAEFGTAQLHAL